MGYKYYRIVDKNIKNFFQKKNFLIFSQKTCRKFTKN